MEPLGIFNTKNHLRYFKHFGLWGQLDKLVFLILISMRPCADLAAFYALGIKEITVWRLKTKNGPGPQGVYNQVIK